MSSLLQEAAARYVAPQRDEAAIMRGLPAVRWRELHCARLRQSERGILLMFELFCERTAALLATFFETQLRRGDAGPVLRQRTAASLEAYMRTTVDPLLALEADAAVAEEKAARGLGGSLLD